MIAKRLGKTQNTRELNKLIQPLRQLDDTTNLLYLGLDYLTLISILAPTITFLLYRESWGLSWFWNVPIVTLAIVLVGAVQHRLAGLGHEASHYMFMKNQRLGELVSDLFCMFPIFATTHQYRVMHMAHHQFTNDWQRDPDLHVIGKSKLMDRFPMSRGQFLYNYFVRFLMPHVLLRYFWDISILSALGKKETTYSKSLEGNSRLANFPITGVLGVSYFFALVGILYYLNQIGGGFFLPVVASVAFLVASVVILILPRRAFFDSTIRPVIPVKISSIFRIGYYTLLLTLVAELRYFTGRNWGPYFLLLWVVPLLTSFTYFMLLRDIYQHANADEGKLTNSRVFFTDPLTWWSVFVYGMDMHVPHHMYPVVPHYNLPELHRLLKENNSEYAEHVVECHGTVWNHLDEPTILDVMEHGTREPEPEGELFPSTIHSP